MPGYRAVDGLLPSESDLGDLIGEVGAKYAWFMSGQEPYEPHLWQTLFHTMQNPETGRLCRFRHLVAGRRGGKTMSAAEEFAFYVTHPEQFHWDYHGKRSERPLWCWVLTKDHPQGLPALRAFREALERHGLVSGVDYKEHRGNRWFEFPNGSFVQFKSADEPEGLRGAGLDMLWIDEAAFIPSIDAWNVVRPALSDKQGMVITTTTPSGKNWFYRQFWSEKSLSAANQGRVEYWSIHNPYFPEEEWQEAKETFHPLLFRQEYMAAFDSMAGKELSGDWLHYYSTHELPRDAANGGKVALRTFLGVDPAISLADDADRFSMALVGVSEDNTQAWLLEQYAGKVPFADQLELIHSWWISPPGGFPRPQFIGVEANAYQAALAQQLEKMPGFPPVIPMIARDKKFKRILAMAPWFKLGKIKIREDHRDFIDEWLNYDSTLRNPEDDCLDAVEIALRTAGVLLPSMSLEDLTERPAGSLDELAARFRPSGSHYEEWKGVDEHLGSDW